MDIHAGRAIMAGHTYLLDFYQGFLSITVEGANILTRNLLIFGQGAMACHYLRDELNAIHCDDCALQYRVVATYPQSFSPFL